MSLPSVTAIVVSYHTGPRLRECLYALIGCPDVSAIRIVDNGNPPGMSQWLQDFTARQDRVTLIDPGANLGFGKGVNLACEEAPAGFLLLVNPDAVIKRDAIAAMIAAAGPLQRPWIAGGKIFGLDGQEGRGARRRELTMWRALSSAAGFDTWNLNKSPAPDGPVPVGAVSGAFLLTDAESFRQLGGFDEAYFLHVEDVDFCRRIAEAGGQVMYTPFAVAMHYGSTSQVSATFVEYNKAKGLTRYFHKNANTQLGRLMAKASFYGFAPLLVVRSAVIRSLMQARQALRDLRVKR